MRLLLCSDIHCDEAAAQSLAERSVDADVLVCAGDLANMRQGLEGSVAALKTPTPTVLVPGNGESDTELAAACEGWESAHVLHGSGVEIGGVPFWGLGAAVPVTPFGTWSFDLGEDEAAELLAGCPEHAVLVTHSPPRGHVDLAGGRNLGSRAVLDAIRRTRPRLVVCGHIHACWEQEVVVGPTRIVNAGPRGVWIELE